MPAKIDLPPYGTLAVVFTYAVAAALWILLSDKVVAWLFDDPAEIALASTFKGWLFIALTSLLLYGLLRRRAGSVPRSESATPARSNLGLFFALPAILVVATIAGFGIARTVTQARDKEAARLEAIADLKVRQITDWLRERREDAEFVQSSIFFAEQYRRWREAGDPASGATLQTRLENFCRIYNFGAVTLLDPEGRRLWNTADAPTKLAPDLQVAAESAARDREIRQIGPYLDVAGHPRLDFVVSLTAITGPAPIVVLHTDPKSWLYLTLQTWPVPSPSGETLLFRRDGDHILYLNELRHLADAALKLREPVAGNEVLAAQAARGDALPGKLVEGIDYRGVPALGVVMPVPGTDWFLVAKLDRAEPYGEIVGDIIWIALAGLLAAFGVGAGAVVLRQRERLVLAEVAQRSQAEHLRALSLLDAIANSSEDAIFAKDLEGRYLLLNQAASRLVGKPAEDVLGRDDTAIFPPEQAALVRASDQQTRRDNHAAIVQQNLAMVDGERAFLTTKGPLHDAAGQIIGFFGISRDITELKRAEQALRESEERLRLASTSARVGVWDWRLRDGKLNWTAELERLYGYAAGTFPGVYEAFHERVHPDDLAEVERLRDEAINANQPFDFDFRVQLPSGATRWINCKGAALYDETGNPQRAFGVNIDITERKQIEETLRWQAEELAQRNAELERFNRAMIGRELDMIALKRQINDLSRELGREPPHPLALSNAPGLDRPANGEET